MESGTANGMDFSTVDMVLEGYLPQMQRDLMALLAIPSVKGEPEDYAPFGRNIADALDFCLAISASLGLAIRNVDGYCGFADLEGAGPEQVGVLAHVDVVPAAADGWHSPPFEPEIREGRLYARGALDDKGPLIASLYAVAALGDCGIPLEKTVRLIFGCDEESGMSCMRYYLSRYQPPDIGFSPDGAFPVIMGEKGIMHFAFTAEWGEQDASAPLTLVSATAGTAANVVPAEATAVFAAAPDAVLPLNGGLRAGITLASSSTGTLSVHAAGRASHASLPELGDNALAKLVAYLSGLDFAPQGAKQFVNKLAELTADSQHGAGFGVAGGDKLSHLTLAPSMLDIGATGGSLTCDMRLPVNKATGDYLPRLAALATENGLGFAPGFCQEPLFLGEEHPLVQTLLAVYREVSGDAAAQPLVQGGGTYAKTMPNCLAFGPELPGQLPLAHQVDEAIEIEHLLQLAKIYARAIYRLAK